MSTLIRKLVVLTFFLPMLMRAVKVTLPNEIFQRQDDEKQTNNKYRGQSKPNKQQQHPFTRQLKLVGLFLHVTMLVNIFILIKYALVELIRLDYFKDYHYLDCFVIGRTLLHCRSGYLKRCFGPYLAIQNLRWQLEMLYYDGYFPFHCFEFLLIGRKQLVRLNYNAHRDFRSIQDNKRPMVVSSSRSSKSLYDTPSNSPPALISPECRRRKSPNSHHESLTIFSYKNDRLRAKNCPTLDKKYNYLKSVFYCKIRQHKRSLSELNYEENYCYRYNRTLEAWNFLSRRFSSHLTRVMLICSLTVAILVPTELFSGLTEHGFEVNYSTCVRWILNERNQTKNPVLMDYIYTMKPANYTLPPVTEALFVPISRLTQMNLYHFLRATMEYFETFLLTLTALCIMGSNQVISLQISDDVLYYAYHVEVELLRYLTSGKTLGRDQINSSKQQQQIIPLDSKQIAKLQAIVEDLLRLIMQYNKFINVVSWRYIFVWITYTSMTATYLFKSHYFINWTNPCFEIYLTQFMFAFICLPILISFSRAKRQTNRLYLLMASCAAQAATSQETRSKHSGNSFELTKSTDLWMIVSQWHRLMQLYYPKPLNTFSIKGRQISWVFALQAFAWLTSALYVVTTSLTMFRN